MPTGCPACTLAHGDGPVGPLGGPRHRQRHEYGDPLATATGVAARAPFTRKNAAHIAQTVSRAPRRILRHAHVHDECRAPQGALHFPSGQPDSSDPAKTAPRRGACRGLGRRCGALPGLRAGRLRSDGSAGHTTRCLAGCPACRWPVQAAERVTSIGWIDPESISRSVHMKVPLALCQWYRPPEIVAGHLPEARRDKKPGFVAACHSPKADCQGRDSGSHGEEG